MKLEDILNRDGIVIRKIPARTVSRWRTVDTASLPANAVLLEKKNGMMTYEQTKENSLSGYMIDFDHGTGSQVSFGKRSGRGETIEEAYNDYFKRN